MRLNTSRTVFACAALVAAVGAPLLAYTAFSLTATLSPTDAFSAPSALTADGGSSYVDRADGRTPNVLMNKSGILEMDTRGSSRTVCFTFAGATTVGQPGLAPKDGCAAVLLRTLIATDNGTVADLADGETRTYSMDVYWTGMGNDLKAHDYVLEFKRMLGSGISVSYAAGNSASDNTWTIDPMGAGQVSIYQKGGRSAGWSVVGTYDMPFRLIAVRQTPNARST
ncbi:MAG: hypothetical protein ABIQ52_08115 [Vicinamibacterales bacterium]